MLIAENVLEQALAQVFDGKPAGTRMALDDIAIAWKGVGLRRSDLSDALQAMVERNYLVVQNDLDNLFYVLTEHGAIRFYICLYCEDDLQKRLDGKREIRVALRDGLVRFADRRATRH
ncbi:MAG: hypothetical protein V4607_08945 [Pseudomonadota bacterium]